MRRASSVILALGLLCGVEGIARLIPAPGGFWQARSDRVLLPAHRYLLWVNAPGEREEQGVSVRINALGLRGPEPTPRRAGTRRLLVTGDSVVYGFGVREEATFTHVAAAALGVEGWTAAVPGYSTYQTLNLLQMAGLDLHPDAVVIGNLWSDLSVTGFADREVLAEYAAAPPGSVVQWLGTHSALFRQLRRLRALSGGADADARVLSWRDRPDRGAAGRRVPIAEYAANLERLVAVCHGAGAEVAFLELPIRDTLKGLAPDGSETAYVAVMRGTARRHGAPLVDAAAALRASGQPPDRLWRDATHLTEDGHAVVGAALAAALGPWAAGAALESTPSGGPPVSIVDPDPTPAAARPMKVPDDMIP